MENNIIEKIQKLLALAGNNSSEAEAGAAALKAQELMAKHGVILADLEEMSSTVEEIKVESFNAGAGRAWKYDLARVISQNFRCKWFMQGKRWIGFYGHATDALAAKEVFQFLFKNGHRLADREVHRAFAKTGYTAGVYNSFCKGFVQGVKEKLDAQCVALMIVMTEDVKKGYEEYSTKFKQASLQMKATGFDADAYNNGRTEGHNAMGRRELEC